MRGARPAPGRCARRREPGHRPARGGGRRQERVAGLPVRPRRRLARRAGRRRRVGDRAGLQRPPPALRPHARSPRPAPRAAARRARDRVRPEHRPRARPVPGRARHADAAGRGRRAAAARLHRGRRAVARPRLRCRSSASSPAGSSPSGSRSCAPRARASATRSSPGSPSCPVQGLGDADARALLLDNVRGPLDAAVCDQIITESRGNPLALLELPRTWNVADLAGGFGLPGSQPATSKIEQSYARRLLQLPADTRLLVLAAAAEPLGDPVLLYRAAETLGLGAAAADPAVDAGLLECRGARRVRAPARPIRRLPLGRRRRPPPRASCARRRHRRRHGSRSPCLAPRPGDARARRGRRRGPRAFGGPGTGARRSRRRGRVPRTGGGAHPRSLRDVPSGRWRRRRASTSRERRTGRCGSSPSRAAGPLGELGDARAQLLRAQIAFVTTRGREAPPLLLDAARRLESLDPALARETYLDAFAAAIFAGRLAQQRRCPRDRGGGARGGVGRRPFGRPARLRSAARRPRASRGARLRGRNPPAEARGRRLRPRADDRRGRAPMAVARTPQRADAGRRRALGRAHRASGRRRSPLRRALDAPRRAARALPGGAVQREPRGGDGARRGGGRDDRRDRQPRAPARRARAGGLAWARGGGRRPRRGRPRRGVARAARGCG